ncbi:MAG: cyclin-domain-containing protein [Benjaminiella poitrasii]|nr:MAG: cyclin-domain-containing protein [Benjaminiella poitrasii]
MTKASILSITDHSELAEFCAVIIPCIWARSYKKPILSPKRHAAFKLYIQKVLKATQISCTCMILALYYIQRLRLAYPVIHASIGSEVRLFTTALVLANKYLDDNTFTNKTWSEVSSIPVVELNIMEIEFLSALDYNIHTSETTYFAWTVQCQSLWSNHSLMNVYNNTTTIATQYNSSSNTINLKRKYDDNDTINNSSSNTISLDCFDNMVKKRKSMMTDHHHQQYCYPTPPPTTICRPILSWSSSIHNNNYALAAAVQRQQQQQQKQYYLTPTPSITTNNSYYYYNTNNVSSNILF